MTSREVHRQGDAVQFLTERYASLTDGEKQIVDYLIHNLEAALSMSVHTLAKNSDVSVATIVRFAQHLGFDGYKSFRLHLAKCSSAADNSVVDFPDAPSSLKAQVTRVLNANTETLQQTLAEMDYGVLERTAAAIRDAGQLLFFGTGTSYVVCNDSMLKYQRSGKFAACACDAYSAALVMANMRPQDLLVVISHSGENSDTLRVLQTAKNAGLKTAAITTFAGSTIAKTADLVLYSKTRESPIHHVSVTSRISQFAVMDALFMAYLTLDYEACTAHNDHLADYLRAVGIL